MKQKKLSPIEKIEKKLKEVERGKWAMTDEDRRKLIDKLSRLRREQYGRM